MRSQFLKKPVLGLLHFAGAIIVRLSRRNLVKRFQADAVAQTLLGVRVAHNLYQRPKPFMRRLIRLVFLAPFALGIDRHRQSLLMFLGDVGILPHFTL